MRLYRISRVSLSGWLTDVIHINYLGGKFAKFIYCTIGTINNSIFSVKLDQGYF